MIKDQGEIRYEMDGAIATITISRPGKRNSMTLEMFDKPDEVVEKAGATH